jgi:hypothetical protein
MAGLVCLVALQRGTQRVERAFTEVPIRLIQGMIQIMTLIIAVEICSVCFNVHAPRTSPRMSHATRSFILPPHGPAPTPAVWFPDESTISRLTAMVVQSNFAYRDHQR